MAPFKHQYRRSLISPLSFDLSLPLCSALVYARTPCRKLGVPRGQRGHFKKYLRSAGCDGSANSCLFFTAQRQPLLYLHRSSPAPARGSAAGLNLQAILTLFGTLEKLFVRGVWPSETISTLSIGELSTFVRDLYCFFFLSLSKRLIQS